MRLTVQGPDSLLQFYLMPDATNEAQQDEKEIGKNVQHAVMALDLKSELNVAREERERESTNRALCQGSRIARCFSFDANGHMKAGMISQHQSN